MSAQSVALRLGLSLLFEVIDEISQTETPSSARELRVSDRLLKGFRQILNQSKLSNSMFLALQTDAPIKDLIEKTSKLVSRQIEKTDDPQQRIAAIEVCQKIRKELVLI